MRPRRPRAEPVQPPRQAARERSPRRSRSSWSTSPASRRSRSPPHEPRGARWEPARHGDRLRRPPPGPDADESPGRGANGHRRSPAPAASPRVPRSRRTHRAQAPGRGPRRHRPHAKAPPPCWPPATPASSASSGRCAPAGSRRTSSRPSPRSRSPSRESAWTGTMPWCVSAHGRDPRQALAAALAHPKAAILTAPGTAAGLGAGPARRGQARLRGRAPRHPRGEGQRPARGNRPRRPQHPHQPRRSTTQPGPPRWLAGHPGAPDGWALPEDAFEHRDSMITKPEVRALVLARLGPAPGRTIWDVGAGSGSVAVECARFGAWVIAIESDPAQCDKIRRNAERHRVRLRVHHGRAPEALVGLPPADAVFAGGGDHTVLAAAIRLAEPADGRGHAGRRRSGSARPPPCSPAAATRPKASSSRPPASPRSRAAITAWPRRTRSSSSGASDDRPGQRDRERATPPRSGSPGLALIRHPPLRRPRGRGAAPRVHRVRRRRVLPRRRRDRPAARPAADEQARRPRRGLRRRGAALRGPGARRAPGRRQRAGPPGRRHPGRRTRRHHRQRRRRRRGAG